MSQPRQNYYSNPAFCQQSEYYPKELSISPRQRALSPERRHPPIGAQKPFQTENYNTPPKGVAKPRIIPRKTAQKSFEDEEEFEEMLVDETRVSSVKKNTQEVDNYMSEDQQNGNRQFVYINGNEKEVIQTKKGRYAIVKVDEDYIEEPHSPKSRYEYIPMQEQPLRTQRIVKKQEEVEINGRLHRYAVIPPEEERPLRYNHIQERSTQARYAEIPQGIEEGKNKYAMVPTHQENNRYVTSPPRRIPERQTNRYEYIPDDEESVIYQQQEPRRHSEYPQPIKSPLTPRKSNPEATQKLHELLITPQKFQKIHSTPQKFLSPPRKENPFQTPTKSPPKSLPRSQPKAQQKLNYTLSTRQNIYDKRQNTAVIAPICSSPVQSVYSETTFSNRTESWMNLSLRKKPIQASLAVAAIMMILCGGLSSGLCFYMVSIVGRMYYLDFGIISGFACLLLGCLGFRGRNCHWLPNRNYISGNFFDLFVT